MSPSELALWSGRIVGTPAALLLLYAAFFLYPGGRKQLQSTLEEWWIRLDDARMRALDRQPVLIQRLAETSRSGFAWLFGEPLSKRFFVISGLLSMASFALAMSTVGDYGWAVPSGLLIAGLTTVWAVTQFGAVSDRMDKEWRRRVDESMAFDRPFPRPRQAATDSTLASRPFSAASVLGDYVTALPPPSYQPPARTAVDDLMEQMPSYLLMVLATTSTGLVLSGARDHGVGTATFLLAFMTAFACDIASILITMALLERLVRARTTIHAAGWLLLDATAAAAMLLIPLSLVLLVVHPEGAVGTYLVFLAAANISTALPSAVYLLIALGLVLHRLLWPLVLRPFYNVVHAERLSHPKTLASLGLALLLLCWPEVLAPFEPIVEAAAELIDS
ncbi:MAG TPA: hypothetical protein VFZ18_09765 [Longimicrobiaceae bacterium]